jgi:hypothetical protein
MIQRPSAVPLVLCKDVLIEHNTKSPSLLRCFTKLVERTFPTSARSFWIYAVLTDGIGTVPLSLRITRLDTMEEVYDWNWQTSLPDPLRIIKLPIHIGSCSFPAPTRYEVVLRAVEEPIATAVMTLVLQETTGA